MASRFCSQCGAEIPDGAQCTCLKGGTKLPSSSAKNPGLAAILALGVPGLGQAYNGNIIKGIGILFGISVIAILMFLVSSFAIFLVLLLCAVGVYDAYRDATLVNLGEIPERREQVLLFCGVVGAVIVAGLVFASILLFFMLSAIGSMFPDVRCANGGCLTPLKERPSAIYSTCASIARNPAFGFTFTRTR